jgi:hypothetical protein
MMLKHWLDKLTSDALARAVRHPDRAAFARKFGNATVSFLALPPGLENGVDVNVGEDEMLALIKRSVEDMAERESFNPFCHVQDGRTAILLFTRLARAEDFLRSYGAQARRIMPFQTFGVQGKDLVGSLDNYDAVILNDGSDSEYKLSPEDLALIRNTWLEP